MARLRTHGWGLGDHGSLTANGAGTTVQAVTKRTGGFAARVTGFTSTTRTGVLGDFSSGATNGPYYARCYVRFAAFPSIEVRCLAWLNSTSISGTAIAWITVDSGGALKLYDEDGQVGVGTVTLSTGTWYRLEMLFNRAVNPGVADVLTARVDGVDFATAADRVLSAGVRSVVVGLNLGAEANTAGDMFLADFALNDSTGASQTSWPGDGRVGELAPSAAGDNTTWTIGGSAAAATNWQSVNEITGDDGVTFVSSNTLNQIDDYTLTDTHADMGASDTVSVVHVFPKFNGAGASANATFVTRLKKAPSGTVNEATGLAPANATWRWNKTAAPATANHTLYADPDAAPWTKATLDTAQAGVRLSVTGTNAAQVTALRVVYEFVPAVGGGGASTAPNLLLLGVG